MRILVFSHEYPPVGGGGGQVARDLCQGLAARGHAVKVITARWGNLPACENQTGVEVLRLNSGRTQPFRAGLLAMSGYVWAAFWAGLREARRWKPDVLHVHFAVPAGAAVWALHQFTRVPYVLTAHLGDVPGGTPEKTGGWFRWIAPFTPPIWRGAARVVAVSGHTRRLAAARYPVPVDVIYNGVDLSAFDSAQPDLHRPPQVVFAGRFMAQKNPLAVVRALSALRDLPWTCVMAGDGPLRADVQAEIDRLGLRERFALPGWIEPAEVQAIFRCSDLLLMPSLQEGLPVVGVQALVAGLALVVSDIGGWRDLVQPGQNGALVPPDRADELAAALRALLSDPARLLSARRSSRELAAGFDLAKIVTEYEQLFQRVAQHPSHA